MKSLAITFITAALAAAAFAQAPAGTSSITGPKPATAAKPAPPGDPATATTTVPAATESAPESGAEITAEPPEKIIARFFAYVQRKEVDLAYDQLTKGTKIAERAEDVKTLKSKTKEAISVFGAVVGYDYAGKKTVGERLVSYTVVSLGKDFPLRWRFYFYKPAGEWKLIDLRVDDRLAAMFDEPEDPRIREGQP